MTERFVHIPLAKLQPTRENIRKTGATAGLEELAASIAAHGLLQNLTVRPIAKRNGKRSDRFEVVAGSRRLAALNLLAERGELKKSHAVPCQVLTDENVAEISLAENVVRAPMHPADQFDAFSALHAQGLGAEDIAARFGVTPTVVAQRLKLAAVSPRLMSAYRAGEMNLEQLMAFTISDDHEAQECVWFDSPRSDHHPQTIRRALTKALVEGSDRRARFVGVETYEAAGGTVIRDLFRPDDEGYFSDSTLLDRLVAEKLAAEAEKVKAEGWSWAETQPEADYASFARYRRVPPIPNPLSDDEQARLDELGSRYDALTEELGEDPPPEVDKELSQLQEEIDQISQRREEWPPDEMARAGALLTLDCHGGLRIERGLVKPDDRTSSGGDGGTGEVTGQRTVETRKTVSDALVEVLTAHRTAALQETLAAQPELAFTALLHTLVLRSFYGLVHETCLDVTPVTHDPSALSDRIGQSKAVAAIAERHRTWLECLPARGEELWTWLMARDLDTKLSLLAYCTAKTLNAVNRKHEWSNSERLAQADVLAGEAGLDMADWWEPTKESYFSRVSKAMILAAVTEAVSPQTAENIAGLKKDTMAARAEELLAGKRWLPEILRRQVVEPDKVAVSDATTNNG